jgi:hypothetical protein
LNLNATIEQFYTNILDYSGVELKDNIFVNKSDKLGDITVDDRHLTLPYFENMKHPEGKLIFHPLNENYTNPENTVFNLYRRRLILELNLKLSSLFISLITVASDIQLQQKIKSSKLIELISSIGEVDHSIIEGFLNLLKASKKVNNESFIFDIFLKKNGEVKDVPYAAIGKVNFHMYSEVVKSLEEKEREYKVYGCKLRKKDLLAFETLFNVIFPTINDKESYNEGTDNKVFRYMNILLKTSYPIAARMNELANLLNELKEPTLDIENIISNVDWVKQLERLYDMTEEIRLIPNQTDVSIEPSKLHLDESKVSVQSTQSAAPPTFNPNMVNQPVTQMQPQPTLQPQQPVQLTPEEIIRGSMGMPQGGLNMQQLMTQPLLNLQQPNPNVYTPSWVQQEMMRTGQMPPNMQQPMQQPQMMTPQMMQHYQQQMLMNQQPMMQPQMMQPQYMQQPMMQPQSSLQVNPMFINRNTAPWQ